MISSIIRRPAPSDLPLIAAVSGGVIAAVAVATALFYSPSIPPAPKNLEVSQGNCSDRVGLKWEPVEEAVLYRVYRDGELIGITDETLFVDDGADPGGVVEAPELTVDGERDDGVLLDLTSPEVSGHGTMHIYEVQAVDDEDRGESATSAGYRKASPVDRWELQVDGGDWKPLDDDPPHLIADVDRPEIAVDDVSASRDRGDYVSLNADVITELGRTSEFRLRGVNEAGSGEPSQPVKGRTAVGELQYQWQRSVDTDGQRFRDIDGATTREYRDEDAPRGQKRHYRLVVKSEGGEVRAVSDAVVGLRDAEPPKDTGEPDAEPAELCEEKAEADECVCFADEDHGLHLCRPHHKSGPTYEPVYLISEVDGRPVVRHVADAESKWWADCGGYSETKIVDFEVVERHGDLLHLSMTSEHRLKEHKFNPRHRVCRTDISFVVDYRRDPEGVVVAMVDRRRACGESYPEEPGLREAGPEPELRTDFERKIEIDESSIRLDGRVIFNGQPLGDAVFPNRDEPVVTPE